MKLPGRYSKVYATLQEHYGLLLRGTVLSIDPSIGSSSSMPGWAVYRRGVYQESGTIAIDVVPEIPPRLQQLSANMDRLIREWDPDILLYEEIPVMGHGRNLASHVSLLKAVGVIVSRPGPRGYIGIYPTTWKPWVRTTYVKSDEADAVELGWVTLELARLMEVECGQATNKKARKARSVPS